MAHWLIEAWEEEHPGHKFSWWRPFPPVLSSGCDYCPPTRLYPFWKRCAERLGLVLAALPLISRWYERNKWLDRAAILFSLVVAALLECAFLGTELMKAFALFGFFGVTLLLLIIAPVLLEAKAGIKLEGAANVLFNVLLTAWSVGFSYFLAKPIADRSARQQWLPFAESACNSLITIAGAAERMRRLQRSQCGSVEKLAPAQKVDELRPYFAIVDSQCREAGEKLALLRDQVNDARKSWESFIRQHCTGNECEAINDRLNQAVEKHAASIAKEVPPCDHAPAIPSVPASAPVIAS